jgi:hypothetical protein
LLEGTAGLVTGRQSSRAEKRVPREPIGDAESPAVSIGLVRIGHIAGNLAEGRRSW